MISFRISLIQILKIIIYIAMSDKCHLPALKEIITNLVNRVFIDNILNIAPNHHLIFY